MFEEMKKVYANLKKAKDDANKRREELQSKYEEFKATVKTMWQEAGLAAQKFKLKSGELTITEKEVSIATTGCGLTNEILQEAADAVTVYLENCEAKFANSWVR